MGVVHKMNEEVRSFILAFRKDNPLLGCRVIARSASEKFGLKISKSSVNILLEESKLSMPVGRRPRAKRDTHHIPFLGIYILKTVEYLFGGVSKLNTLLTADLQTKSSENLARIEYLLYSSIFVTPKEPVVKFLSPLWEIIGRRFNPRFVHLMLNNTLTTPDLCREMSNLISEGKNLIRAIKLSFPNGNSYFLDSQMHTVWTFPRTPEKFSAPNALIQRKLNGVFNESKPLILLMSPGYSTPSKDLFLLINDLEAPGNSISCAFIDSTLEGIPPSTGENDLVSLRANGMSEAILPEIASSPAAPRNDSARTDRLLQKEAEMVRLPPIRKLNLIFGLWPWQFQQHLRIINLGEYKAFSLASPEIDGVLAKIELELTQPDIPQPVTLRGYAYKKSQEGQIALYIVSTLPPESISVASVAEQYFSKWPNLEAGVQDFSRVIEDFKALSHPERSEEGSEEILRPQDDMKKEAGLFIGKSNGYSGAHAVFAPYLELLDGYVQDFLLPLGRKKTGFSTMIECFYKLPGWIKIRQDEVTITLLSSAEFHYARELEYLVRRLNELEVNDYQGKRIRFRVRKENVF